jgi:hypothetical protein
VLGSHRNLPLVQRPLVATSTDTALKAMLGFSWRDNVEKFRDVPDDLSALRRLMSPLWRSGMSEIGPLADMHPAPGKIGANGPRVGHGGTPEHSRETSHLAAQKSRRTLAR